MPFSPQTKEMFWRFSRFLDTDRGFICGLVGLLALGTFLTLLIYKWRSVRPEPTIRSIIAMLTSSLTAHPTQ